MRKISNFLNNSKQFNSEQNIFAQKQFFFKNYLQKNLSNVLELFHEFRLNSNDFSFLRLFLFFYILVFLVLVKYERYMNCKKQSTSAKAYPKDIVGVLQFPVDYTSAAKSNPDLNRPIKRTVLRWGCSGVD